MPKSTITFFGHLGRALRRRCCRKMFAACGSDLNVEQGAWLGNGKDVKVGSHVGIGKDFTLHNCILTIEDNLLMGEEVMILGGGHNYDGLDVPMGQQGSRPKTTLHISVMSELVLEP